MNSSEPPLAVMAQKQPISNNGGHSAPMDEDPANFKSPGVFSVQKKYFCEYCSKSFSRSGHLEMHRRTHTGERPFVCQYCSRAFTQSSALYRHHKTCVKSPNKGNNEQLFKNVSILEVSTATAKQQETTFSASGDSLSTCLVDSAFQEKDDSSDDDDIMFLCCDHTFTSSTDYDKHVRTHHPKSHTDSSLSLSPHGNSERGIQPVTAVHLASNSYEQHVTDDACFDLSHALGQGNNARVRDKESGVVYLVDNSNNQDTVTINLSEHSVNDDSGTHENISISDECSNSGMRQVTSKLTCSSNDLKGDDEDVFIEATSIATEQNNDGMSLDDDIFILENESPEKTQISQIASSKKQNQKCSEYSMPLFDVASKFGYNDVSQHQKSLSNSFYIRNLPNSLSFKKSIPDGIKKNSKVTSNLQKLIGLTEENAGVENSRGQSASNHSRLKSSRLKSCQFCSRQFTRTSHLTQHLRTHTGERPFRCEYCGNAFTQTSALNRHLKTCNVAQSVNSSVAGNATSLHQPSALSVNSNFDANNDVGFSYEHSEEVFQQSPSLETHLKVHKDNIDAKVAIKNPLPKGNSLSLSDSSNSTADVHYSANFFTLSSKHKSHLTKMTARSGKDQALRPKKKRLLQRFVKCDRMLRCDICFLEFVSRKHLAAHARKHLQSNSVSSKTVQSSSRNLLPSSLAWTLSSKNKHLFRNKVYNTLKYKRNFEKQKSFTIATNSQSRKTYSLLEKSAKKSSNHSKGAKSEACRTNQQHHSKIGQLSEESTQDSVVTGANKNPQNSFLLSDLTRATDPHQSNRISSHVYTCDICAKSFYSDLLFNIHRSTHSLQAKKKNNPPSTSAKKKTPSSFYSGQTSEADTSTFQDKVRKTFLCIYCHKTFLRHSHLETHVRTHTGEKPFRCESCGRAFSQSSARNRHIKTCFMARQIMSSELESAESLLTSNHPETTVAVKKTTRKQDEAANSITFTCCDQSFNTSIDLNAHILNHKSSKYPHSEETFLEISPLSFHLKSHEVELQNHKVGGTYGNQTTTYISESPIKCEENTDSDLNIYRAEQQLVNNIVISTDKFQIKNGKPHSPATKNNEMDDPESKIFDSALQVVHESLQMRSGGSLQQASSSKMNELPTSEPDPEFLEVVRSQNCPNTSDICPPLSDIPQPNVSLSLGSEFVDIMDTDLSSISNTIPCGQEEESSALQKDIFPEFSPETPPFVSECLLPKSSAEIDDPLGEDEVCKSSGSGTFQPSPNLNEPDKNYTCDYCGKIFSQSEHFNSHVRMHMSDRFFCPSCSAVFMQASALSRHFKVCTQVDGTDKGSLSKNDLDTQGTVDMSQDFQISVTEVPSNKGDTYESIRTYKLPVCSSLEVTMDITDNSNNFQEPLEHWTLTSFSNSEIVKSEEMEDSVCTKNRKETVVNTDNLVNVKINSSDLLKKLTKCTSDDQEKEIPIETDSQALTGDFICSYCDRHFASPHHLDEHVSCHSVKKAYVCWFCKETYALSSDFEQHLKICGAPATFPNLSSPNTSKKGSDDEDSKFVDIALFTPLTASANLSDCDEGGGGETDIPCTEDQAKDKSSLARVSQCLQLESLVDNVPSKPEGILKEKKHDIVKTFESVEFLSRQMQDNSPGESSSNSDTGSKFTESLANNVIGQEKNNTINDCLKIACNNNSTIQNDICDRVLLNQSKRDIDLEESFVKEVDNAKDDATKKNLISERISSQLHEFIISSTDCLKTQSSSEDSTNSVVFICCQQTYAEVQDYNQHLLNCHPEYTSKKLGQQIQSSSETLKEGLILNRDTSPVSKQLDVSDNPLLPLNAGDQRRYVCHYCTRGFTRSGHLNQHMRTHTGERPYPCQFCSKAFTQSSALNRHLKTCNKAKLFYNDELKIMNTNYSVILSEFQQTLDGNGNNSSSNNIAPSLIRSLDNKKHDNVSSGNDLLQPSHLNFNSIDKIQCDETNEGITKCEHCGHKCLKLDEFTEHRKTCPSNSTIYMSRSYHQENDSPGKEVDNEFYNNSIQHRVLMEDIDKEEQPSNIEIKKEVLDVIFECEFCHELFADELKLAQHQESHCVQNEQQEWNMGVNFENGEMRKTIKDEETCTFTCCGQMFLGLESYNFHMENHHSFEDRDDYMEMIQPDSKMQERQSKSMGVKNETGSFGHETDRYLNSSPEKRQLISLSKSKHDDNIGKKVSDELSGLSSVDRSTALDNISRFQVLESVKEISHPETSISSQGIAVSDIENPKSDSNSPMTSKELRGMALAALSSNETSLSNDTNLNWLQWENYITGQLSTSSTTTTSTTAVMSSRDKRYSCDYCDKKFTRSGHLVMHWRTHTGERPFSCRHCHKAFTQSSALNRHLKTCNLARLAVAENLEAQPSASATEEGIQLSCCGKNFYWTQALNVHQVIHNIYKCHCCNQNFENFELLLMHIKSHDLQEQLPVSFLSGKSTDSHCNCCPASFQSVIEQLIHMKTEHGVGATEGLSAHNHISSKFQKQPFLSSKTEYLNRGKCSKDSNVLFSTKKSSNSSSSISSQQKNCSNRPNIRKISRFKRFLSSSNFRMPLKSNAFSKHRQNKQEIYPAPTLLRRRYSSLFSDQRSVSTPEFTQSNMSARSQNVRRAIKRAVNNIGKHRPFSEQFAPSLGAQMPTQANQQRATTSVGTVKHLDQAEQDNNRTLMKILLNNKNNQVNSKSIIKREVIENKTYGRRKKKFPNSQLVRDQDVGYLPETQFDNDLQPDDPSCQAAASSAKCLKEEKSNLQPRKPLSHSGVQKHPNLKTRPRNSLHLKRSLLSELGSLGTEGNSLSNKAVHSSSKYNLKSSKYKKGAGLPMVVGQTSSQFICTICKKGFTCSSHLKIHYRTHTEGWPYTCTSCSRCFMQVSTLNSHRKTCPYRKSINANLAPSSNSIPPNPGTTVVSDEERNTPLSVGNEESVSLTSSQSHWGKANVENRAVVTNEHDKLLASFSPPSNSDKELSVMIKTPSEGLNLQQTKTIIADSSDILSDESLGPEKASPYTEVKFLVQKETATSNDNFNEFKESQHQLEISEESFQGCKDCRQNSRPSCPHQKEHTPSSFSKYIIKIEPGSEAVNSCSASKEPFQLYNSLESAGNKSSRLSQENLKDYLSNNDLTRSKEQTDLTSFSLPQPANNQINDGAKSEPSCGQLGAKQLEGSTLPASHGKSEGSHVCKNCGLTFHQLNSLIQHNCPRKVNRYPFSCEYCDKSFTRHSRLVTHRRTHTGERPYQCRYCQRSFTQTSALYRHQKTCSFIPAHLKATPVKSSKS